MPASNIESTFPRLRREGYRITSSESTDYNCFAWAAHDSQNWWSPVDGFGYHWPRGVTKTLKLESFVELYQRQYDCQICDSHRLEPGFEKIAIYVNDQKEVTHAARQTCSGSWTSKLGDWEDIEHNTLAAIEGQFYGKVAQILKRPI